jgi:DNA repair protein RecN (Recombination protein N)
MFLQLEQDHRRQSHAGEMLAALNRALAALETDEHNAGSLLAQARREIEPLTALDPDLGETAGMLEVALLNLEEARASLNQARDRVDLDPARLAKMEQKLGQLHDLARKHRVEPDQLEAHTAELEQRLLHITQADKTRTALHAELESAEVKYRRDAANLSKLRQDAASQLASEVSNALESLAMEQSGFAIMVGFDGAGIPRRSGLDRCEYLLGCNPGQKQRPLKKIASGGELSRVSLAIKAVASAGNEVETQIFDEVDAGIGGTAASAVGTLLAGLAPRGQALCVTHLAQVAACAAHQLNVSKQPGADSTSVTVSKLHDEQRIEEIARMLSGERSEQSIAHAKQLLASVAG